MLKYIKQFLKIKKIKFKKFNFLKNNYLFVAWNSRAVQLYHHG